MEVRQNAIECSDMTLILFYGVVQLVFVAIDVLCPIFIIGATVYPTLIVLGFNDEDAIF